MQSRQDSGIFADGGIFVDAGIFVDGLTRRAFGALAAGLAVTGMARAQDAYPNRFIRIIVGPGPDIVARLFGPKITAALGQDIVVEPRPGAGGIIAAQGVATAPPDGYTLLLNSASYTIGNALGTMPQDMLRDFTPVALLATAPFVLVVHPSVKARNIEELIALAKANPGKLNYASSGIGTPPHLAAELFKSMAGVDIVHVPFREANSALNAVVAGSVQIMFSIASVAKSQLESNTVRGLGVSTLSPSELVPGMATIAGSGLPGYEVQGWNGLVAPAGTPQAITRKLNAALQTGLKDPDIHRLLSVAGYETAPENSPEQFADFMKKDTEKWTALVASAGIKK